MPVLATVMSAAMVAHIYGLMRRHRFPEAAKLLAPYVGHVLEAEELRHFWQTVEDIGDAASAIKQVVQDFKLP